MDLNLPITSEWLKDLSWTKVGLALLGIIIVFGLISRIASFFLWPLVRGVIAGVVCFIIITWAATHYHMTLGFKWALGVSIVVAIVAVFVRRPKSD
jgi:hypothetical protein